MIKFCTPSPLKRRRVKRHNFQSNIQQWMTCSKATKFTAIIPRAQGRFQGVNLNQGDGPSTLIFNTWDLCTPTIAACYSYLPWPIINKFWGTTPPHTRTQICEASKPLNTELQNLTQWPTRLPGSEYTWYSPHPPSWGYYETVVGKGQADSYHVYISCSPSDGCRAEHHLTTVCGLVLYRT